MTKTNTGLVAYAKAQIGKPYWYGTFGQTATADLHASKKRQYPKYYDQKKYKVQFVDQYGKRVHDCVGLIKGYLWSTTSTSRPYYNGAQDVDANRMLKICTKSGKISTIPEIPGVLVFLKNHVGVYIGGGEVVQAKGHDYGVVRTKLSADKWTHWGKCPYIAYAEPEKITASAAGGYEVKVFKNTSGKVLTVYAGTSMKVKVGTIFNGSTCAALGEVGNLVIVRYKVTGTGEYKVGFTDYVKGVQF